MAVVTLLDVAGPAAPPLAGPDPSAAAWRFYEAISVPRLAVGRMFQNASPFAHGTQRGDKTVIVIPQLKLMGLARRAMPEPPPPLTRGMSYDRPRPGVFSRVALNRPQVHARQSCVDAIGFNKECGNLFQVDPVYVPVCSRRLRVNDCRSRPLPLERSPLRTGRALFLPCRIRPPEHRVRRDAYRHHLVEPLFRLGKRVLRVADQDIGAEPVRSRREARRQHPTRGAFRRLEAVAGGIRQ